MQVETLETAGDRVQGLLRDEWLVPLGNGGYASSTVTGINSRAYHGLLVGCFPDPEGRRLLLSHVDETFIDEAGERIDLGCNLYDPDVVHPEGYRHIESFEAEPFPTWVFAFGQTRLLKRVVGFPAKNAVALVYELMQGPPGRLELRWFPTDRSAHGGDGPVRGELAIEEKGRARWTAETGRVLHLATNGAYEGEPIVYENFRFERECSRGYSFSDDFESAGLIARTLSRKGRKHRLWVYVGDEATGGQPYARVKRIIDRTPSPKTARERLEVSMRGFLVKHPSGAKGLLAGYPWFTEWGRDTMIALPGLAVALGSWDEGRRILAAWAGRVSLGMIPNRLTDGGETEIYNSADASLLFARAVARWYEATGDKKCLRRDFLPALVEIAHYYDDGTRFGIQVDDEDGLLTSGVGGVALTWMDALVDGRPVTPRRGKCVELNALYLELLRFLSTLHGDLGQHRDAKTMAARSKILEANFAGAFFDENLGFLRDRVGGEEDHSLRPNQLFALGLADAPLSARQKKSALAAVEASLLTPFGLRTLAPDDPHYIGRYGGDQATRDRAYHQGTVWPWLFGPYVDALLATRGSGPKVKLAGREALEAILATLDTEGLGEISEVFAGDSPHRPGGCIAQAWSTAELLRAAARLGTA